MSKARCFVALKGDGSREVVGFGAIRRKFNKSYEKGIISIAPLFANSREIATQLIVVLLESATQVSLWEGDSDYNSEEVRSVAVDTHAEVEAKLKNTR